MSIEDRKSGVVRARTLASSSVEKALGALENEFSELDLAEEWINQVALTDNLRSFGWYQPPPNGVSVLIGNPPDYARLRYQSLRAEDNWPRGDLIYSQDSLLYPYFSAIDKETGMIGDFVGTFYAGSNKEIKDWISSAYNCTKKIAEKAKVGMSFSELFEFANNELKKMGGKNNNFSLSGGLANDIGHTIPFYKNGFGRSFQEENLSKKEIIARISKGREFLSFENHEVIDSSTGFTIEPQIISDFLPMVSFHMIVLFSESEKIVLESFDKLFHRFGMDKWIYQVR